MNVKVRKVDIDIRLDDLIGLYMVNHKCCSVGSAREYLSRQIQQGYNFFVAYSDVSKSPIGYLNEKEEVIEEIFVVEGLRKQGNAIRMLEILLENEKPEGFGVWHLGRDSTEGLMKKWSENMPIQYIELDGNHYAIPLSEFDFGPVIYVTPLNNEERIRHYFMIRLLKA